MKGILPFILISILMLSLAACLLNSQEKIYFVYYDKGRSKSGSAPIDKKKYNHRDTITILDKGTLINEDYLFLGWMFNNNLYQPGDKLTHNYERDIRFTASWDDGIDAPFDFVIEGNEVKIIRYTGSSDVDIIIPSRYSDIPVTEIGNDVLRNKSIKSVKMFESLKRIGSFAFANCSIASLVIPNSLEIIGAGAFQNNGLDIITFGSGLTSIPIGAFGGNSLTFVSLPANIKLIQNGAFFDNKIVQIKIGAGVEIINDTSFGIYGASFKEVYEASGKLAGEYNYTNDNWVKKP
jgi:hypothetical protein